MKNLKILMPCVLIIGCLFLFSCINSNMFDGKCGGEYSFEYDNSLICRIFNKKTKEDVLRITNTHYNYDTVNVYQANWKPVYLGAIIEPISTDGLVAFQFIDPEKDKGIVDQLIVRRFYMYFNYYDIDTIDIAFETKYNECRKQEMKYFKVAYNDSVYFDGPVHEVPDISFLKE